MSNLTRMSALAEVTSIGSRWPPGCLKLMLTWFHGCGLAEALLRTARSVQNPLGNGADRDGGSLRLLLWPGMFRLQPLKVWVEAAAVWMERGLADGG